MHKILGLDTHPASAIRWTSYKLRLAERGELVNADGLPKAEDVREVVALLCDKMSMSGQRQAAGQGVGR